MKKYITIIGAMLMASCTLHTHTATTAVNEHDTAETKSMPAPGMSTIQYDDSAPNHIRTPHLLYVPDGYDEKNRATYPIYTGVHTVGEPISKHNEDRIAIWCTKEATYVATVNQFYTDMVYIRRDNKSYIRDCNTGKKYEITEYLGLTLDSALGIKGVPGQYFCTVRKYPPLPDTCTIIDFITCEGYIWLNNGTKNTYNICVLGMRVSTLQSNQYITQLKENKVIE